MQTGKTCYIFIVMYLQTDAPTESNPKSYLFSNQSAEFSRAYFQISAYSNTAFTAGSEEKFQFTSL